MNNIGEISIEFYVYVFDQFWVSLSLALTNIILFLVDIYNFDFSCD